MNKRCYIVGAGEFSNKYQPKAGELIIAADAGLVYLEGAGLRPDIVIGDFDSLGAYPKHPNVMQSPEEKDDTDMMLAVNEALRLGYKTLIIDGGLGGRQDHTMANYQILANIARRGARGILLGKEMCVTAVKDDAIRFLPPKPLKMQSGVNQVAKDKKDFISIFCIESLAAGVNLSGLKYRLEDAELTYDYPIGVSNEFIGEAANISVRNGTLIVIWSGDYKLDM